MIIVRNLGRCHRKDDVSPQEIFELQKQGPAREQNLLTMWMFYFVMNSS